MFTCADSDSELLFNLIQNVSPAITDGVAGALRHGTNAAFLETLSKLAIDPRFTYSILSRYEHIFVDLVARWPSMFPTREVNSGLARLLPVAEFIFPFAEAQLFSQQSAEAFIFGLDSSNSHNTEYNISAMAHWSSEDVLDTLVSLYRLLSYRPLHFVRLVEPKIMWTLLQSDSATVRYLAIRILGIYLGAAEEWVDSMAKRHLGRESLRAEFEGADIDFYLLPLHEKRRLSAAARDIADQARTRTSMSSQHSSRRVIVETDLSGLAANIAGVLLPKLAGPSSTHSTLIETPTTRNNLQKLAQALRRSGPILLSGPSGSGKTSAVYHVANKLNVLKSLVSIHLGDQTDAKLLLGAYNTTDKPGVFEWRRGVLTRAVQEGRWVLVEDIDKAPSDVLSVILPLLEKGELKLSSRGETIRPGSGFRLIATLKTIPGRGGSDFAQRNILGARFWRRIDIAMCDSDELKTIITTSLPLLSRLSTTIMNIFAAVQRLYLEPSFFVISKTSMERRLSPRDLVRWCNRVHRLLIAANITPNATSYPERLYDHIFLESVDCFAGSLQTTEARVLVTNTIAAEMQFPPQKVKYYLQSYSPSCSQTESQISIGRVKLKRKTESASSKRMRELSNQRPFATTNHAALLLEQIGSAVGLAEPVLLVGETGTGKTSVVQELARVMRCKLTAVNLSQQTESGDLIGGYKPVDERGLINSLKEQFDVLFESTFAMKKNTRFLAVLGKALAKQQWNRVMILWREAVKMSETVLVKPVELPDVAHKLEEPLGSPKKKRKVDSFDKQELAARWSTFAKDVENLERQMALSAKSFAFSFVEGPLVKAARNGDWILLDEINLAAPATLEAIADLLQEQENRSILLSEKGQVERVRAHPDFRIFACMNPATDVGKKDLPPGVRSRFTELYVTNPDQDLSNLLSIIKEYLGDLCIQDPRAPMDIAQLYLEAKQLAEQHKLVDGANQRPHFSIRTLARTLSYVVEICPVYGLRRALHEGFCMNFLTQLDQASENVLFPIILKHVLGSHSNAKSLVSQVPKRPQGDYVQFRHYWMHGGDHPILEQQHYIITPFVERNMLNLVRATATRKFPVLIQGPTSSGKTSMIEYLAKKTGHKFVRINNHEHTDLQEYLGSYVSDMEGKLHFQEGVLVEALRKGYWIVLDELNLAPTDVLESLNRLLDDNRELLVPETQEVIRPHKNFMLFATQNPPGLYGGRKQLSRAFRNRFLELHFDDIPEDELREILEKRTQIAPPYCAKIVEVYKELSILRQSSRLFEQKHSFATLRDLFRWAGREAIGYDALARNGFMLLAEKVRKPDEKEAVKRVIEKVMKVRIDEAILYCDLSLVSPELAASISKVQGKVVWTKAMTRLYYLVASALKNNEPVLLVGETGCGKTTVCQLLASACSKQLLVVNAHMNTETGDIIGAQRPIRSRARAAAQLLEDLTLLYRQSVQQNGDGDYGLDLETLIDWFDALPKDTREQLPQEIHVRICESRTKLKALFEWCDGSLVQAMREGQFFLLDEISLADDSVLERLNSVLEPERSILLAEKGPNESFVIGEEGFQFMATMNPGGDYGKRELSPALRNRFTEIWVPPMTDMDDVMQIASSGLIPAAQSLAGAIVDFTAWFGRTYILSTSNAMSIRDVLSWVHFVNAVAESQGLQFALLQGAAMVFIDGLGANPSAVLTISTDRLADEKKKCVEYLSTLAGQNLVNLYSQKSSITVDGSGLSIGTYSLAKRSTASENANFNLWAPTTSMNAMRVLRAMRLNKPILLEGNPGVGKTSLVSALAKISGNPLTRINLSEQTDLMDLFGSDVPKEGGKSGEFQWRDAPFLRAMQLGHWVLLDEMNLASQAVLEGLNACLDHRGEAYISELDRTFKRHQDFRVFAAQNPHHQGGGRKGLPASFVNRFTVVHVNVLSKEDLLLISCQLFPRLGAQMIQKIVDFVALLEQEVVQRRLFGRVGAPWEFNLRDILRWLELLAKEGSLSCEDEPAQFIDIIIKQRFRSLNDKRSIDNLYMQVFGSAQKPRQLYHSMSPQWFQVGHALVHRNASSDYSLATGLSLLQHQLPVLETVMTCLERSWPCILVGPSGIGKTSVIKLLASIIGTEVDEFALNADVDTTDIVGGFEQADHTRKLKLVVEDIQKYAKRQLVQMDDSDDDSIESYMDLLLAAEGSDLGMAEILGRLFEAAKKLPATGELVSLINSCQRVVEDAKAPEVNFEWFDGVIVRAAQEGRWLVLDNANLSSPSVLDRLNSLLEPDGFLAINEHGDKNGDARIVRPHKNFRLFLTMDPRHGELSRAMRNRGVEIFMSDTQEIVNDSQQTTQEFDPAVVTMSSMANFALLQRTIELFSTRTDFDKIFQIALDHLPTLGFDNLQKWLVSVGQEVQSTSTAQATTNAVEKYMFMRSHKLAKLFHELSQVVCENIGLPNSYGSAQPMNAFKNPYLLHRLSDANLRQYQGFLRALIEAFRLLQSSLEMLRFEQNISQSAPRIRAPDMTYLERLIVENSSGSRGGSRTGSLILEFLSSSRVLMTSFLDGLVDAPDTMAVLSALSSLERIWWDFVAFSTSRDMDDAVLQVFVTLIRSWLDESSSIVPASLTNSLSLVAHKFRDQLELTTGFSMERIWNAMRPAMPSSVAGIESYHGLLKLTDRFDDLALRYKGAFSDIITLKSAFLRALSSLRRDNMLSAEAFSELEKTISQLESYAGEDVVPVFFSSQFDTILKYRQLRADNGHNLEENSSLVLFFFSRRTIRSLAGMKFASQGAEPTYTPVLSSIWRDQENVEAGILDLVIGEFGIRNLGISATVRKSGIGSMVALESELSNLCQQYCLNLDHTTDDVVTNLSKMLLKEIRRILQVHADSYDPSLNQEIDYELNRIAADNAIERVERLTQLISQTSNQRFCRIAVDLLSTSVSRAASSSRTDVPVSERLANLGVAWTYFAVACLSLYIPNVAFDPAMKPRILKRRYLQQRARVRAEIEAQEHFERLFTGGDNNTALEMLRQELVDLGSEPEGSNVARPEMSEISNLHGEFVNLLSLLKSQLEHGLLRLPEPGVLPSDVENNQESVLQMNISRIIERLENNYPCYADITELAVAFLYALKLGQRIVRHSRSISQKKSLTNYLLGTSSPLLQGGSEDEFLPQLAECEDAGTLVHYLWQLACRTKIETGVAKPRVMDVILRRFLQVWKRKTEDERAEAVANSSIYRYKGLEEQTDDEHEMQNMFPVFDEEASEQASTSEGPNERRLLLSDNMGSKIAEFYTSFFLRESNPKASIENIVLRSAKLVSKLNAQYFVVSPPESQDLLPLNILSLRDSTDWLKGKKRREQPEVIDFCGEKHQPGTFDFYKDENVAEAQELVKIITSTRVRLRNLMDTWPENETLRDAWTVTTEILQFSIKSPVAKFLTKVEKLHSVLNEWQSVASREFSAAGHYDIITQLIVRWRRLELSCWPRLLKAEEEKCRDEAFSWWFYGYESVIVNSLDLLSDHQDISEHVGQLVSTLNAFITSSSVGEFSPRLALLSAFQAHCNGLIAEYPSMEAVHSATANVITYYSQFQNQIQSSLSQHRGKLEKNVKDVILLASWKDTNITALRESARRSHYKLYKVVKKYRLALSQPVSVAIASGLQETKADHASNLRPSARSFEYLIDTVSEAQLECAKRFVRWIERPMRLLEVQSTVGIMIKTRDSGKEKQAAFNILSDFTSNIVSTIKELRQETPTVLTEDNQVLVKQLKSRKQKTVTDTLKELKKMGLRSNLGGDTLERQSGLEKILAAVPELNLASFDGIDSADNQYFFRILELLPKVRMAASQHSPDISAADIIRGVGYFEHVLAISLLQRTKLASSLKQLAELRNFVKKYHVLGSGADELYPNLPGDQEAYVEADRALRWLPKILDLAQTLIDTQAGFAQADLGSTLHSTLQKWKDECIALGNRIEAQRACSQVVVNGGTRSATENTAAYLSRLRDELQTVGSELPQFKYITRLLEPWISKDLHLSEPSDTDANQDETASFLSGLDTSLQKLCNSILVALQHLHEAQSSAPDDDSEKGWLTKHQSSQLSALKSLHVSDVTSQIASLIDDIGKSPHITANAAAIRAILTFSFPIIAEYANACSSVVSDALSFHTAVCKLGHVMSTSIVTLANSGFCTPAEKDEAKGKENASGMEEGTGLGDGEGVEDISGDLDDEDINNLAEQEQQEEGDEKEEKEVEAEDKAMEMDDMEGKMEDAKEQNGENDEDDDGNDRDEDDALDEESGDVDELDPNAVDEKFWDEKGEDKDEEKDGGKGLDGERSEDMEAKNEKEKKEDENKSDKDKGDPEAEDSPETDEDEAEGAEESDQVAPKDENDIADQHMPEVDTLELPEDLKLDGGEDSSGGEEQELDENMDDLSEQGDLDERLEEQQKYKDENATDNQNAEENSRNEEDAAQEDVEEEMVPDEQADEMKDKEEPEKETINQEEELHKTGESGKDESAVDHDIAPSDVRGQDDYDKDEDTIGASNAETGEQREGAQGASGIGEDGAFERARREPAKSAEKEKEKDAREAAMEELFRKLGDPLQRFYKPNKEILNTSDDNENQEQAGVDEMDVENTEFEHLQNENDKDDTQALGAATAAESRGLDESMAIDPTEEAPQETFEDDIMPDQDEVVEGADERIDGEAAQDAREIDGDNPPDDQQEKHAGALIGKATRADASEDSIIMAQGSLSGVEEEDEEEAIEQNGITPEMDHLSLVSSDVPLSRPYAEARTLWQHYESSTRTLSLGLTEQLRLILEPTLNTKMRGDFRTGKRLNMKRIIPYIASDYKKDKIWMRRSKPSKRSYQVMIALDDSKSMSENPKTTSLAFETVALIAKALAQLEVGEIAIASFGENTRLVHPFDRPFTSDAGVDVFARLGFTQTKTNVRTLLESSLSIFETARSTASSSAKDGLWQLEIIISDGICEEHDFIRRLLRAAHERKIMVVFVVVDAIRSTSAPAGGKSQQSSIIDMKEVVFEPNAAGTGSSMKIRRYMDSFPFGYYLLVRQVDELPHVLATALRQWLAEIVDATVG